jgi:hypothetical protein
MVRHMSWGLDRRCGRICQSEWGRCHGQAGFLYRQELCGSEKPPRVLSARLERESVLGLAPDWRRQDAKNDGWGRGRNGSHLVEIVLVELADKGRKVGVLEETGKDDLCELGHVLYDEAVALGTPADDGGEIWFGEHAGSKSAGNDG